MNTTKHKDIFDTFINDLILQLLSFFAENERLCIKQRQEEGIAAAKAKGVHFGRPVLFEPEKYVDVYYSYRTGKISRKTARSTIGCGETTFRKIMNTIENNKAINRNGEKILRN